MEPYQRLASMGLYEPATERAACGVGFIASLNGVRSHDIVHRALEILVHLEHRGACGLRSGNRRWGGYSHSDPSRVPEERHGAARGFDCPIFTSTPRGSCSCPPIPVERAKCEEIFEAVIKREGQEFLGWRDVPRNSEVIGPIARAVEPVVRQVFIGRGRGVADDEAFERKLYVIRKVMEAWARSSGLTQARFFYVPSLSHRTLNYKGLLLAPQIEKYYQDLSDPSMISGIALVHQRYSTNTFPTWDLAQPFRFLCHNGEINTLRGNVNWMHAREKLFMSPSFGEDMAKILPISTPGASDSAILDNAIELLYHTGRSLPHCVAMLIPEAWQNHRTMSDTKKAFYEYHSCLMEPWDGPASIAFTDGKVIGAVLDRNGLRPSRYMVTKDGYVIMSSETGVLEVDPANVCPQGDGSSPAVCSWSIPTASASCRTRRSRKASPHASPTASGSARTW